MLRTKRSHLQGQGLRVKELASVGNNGSGGSGSNGNSPNSRRPQAASTLIDREQAVDVYLPPLPPILFPFGPLLPPTSHRSSLLLPLRSSRRP